MKVKTDHGGIMPEGKRSRFHQAPARISLRGARASYVGPGLGLSPHRNAVAVVAIGLDASFEVALSVAGEIGSYQAREAVLIPPGVRHHLKPRGRMVFLYLDPLGDDHAALRVRELDAGAFRRTDVTAYPVDALCELLGLGQRLAPDPRVAALLRAIEADPDRFRSFGEIASEIGLSPSRSRELLRQATGVPFRRYRLWRRMALVMLGLSRKRSLTEVAHDSGFASSAHLSAAFREMFGLSPSELMKLGASIDFDIGPRARQGLR